MIRRFVLLTCLMMLFYGNVVFSDTETAIDSKVEKILTQMTLEEKVAQMVQLDIGFFLKEGSADEFNEPLLDSVVRIYNIGSILGHGYKPITSEEWYERIDKIQTLAKSSRLGIPVLYGVDAIHGPNFFKNEILYPHNIGLPATRNPQLGYEIARNTANIVRASGIPWNFDPVLDVAGTPLWPRFEETFGEDPLLVTRFGNQVILGYQTKSKPNDLTVASCMKHFLGYGFPVHGFDRTPALIPDYMLKEMILPPFKEAIKNGSFTIMINSGSINGIPVHVNKNLLTRLLKDELGFKGLVVTDWLDIKYLHNAHYVAKDYLEAIAQCINAGVDMSMVPSSLDFYHELIQLAKQGEVPIARIDEAVSSILYTKMKLGLFENPLGVKDAIKRFKNREQQKNLALKAALESITLLKNETINNQPILPLDKNSKVLITGPTAHSVGSMHGSWSFTHQGKEEEAYPDDYQTFLQAYQENSGKENVLTNAIKGFHIVDQDYRKEAAQLAQKADYVLLCIGEVAYAEGGGNINDLTLSEDQIELFEELSATGKPIVLILLEGRPRVIRKIADQASAILMAYRPACMGGEAITEILTGKHNPEGKLPFNYPAYPNNLLPYHFGQRADYVYQPEWEFGYGLSYTSFEYSNLKISSDTIYPGDTLTISLQAANTGKMPGNISTDLFIRDMVASIAPPMKKLKDFTKTRLEPGESKTIEFQITTEQLAIVNADGKWVTEPGMFKVMAGGLEKSVILVLSDQ